MSAPRPVALLGVAAGAVTAAGPFLGWFRFAVPGAPVTVSGVDASGASWVVALLGLAAVAVAAGFARRPVDGAARAVGVALTAVGLLACGWAAWVATRAPVDLSVGTGPDRIGLGLEAERLAPAVVTPLAAAVVALSGLLLARPRPRWPW